MKTTAILETETPEYTFERVVFFGRTFRDYLQFFAFEEEELQGRRILDVAAGPASFTAEAIRKRFNVTATDPLYDRSFAAIQSNTQMDFETVVTKTEQHQEKFDFKAFGDFAGFVQARKEATEGFLADYTAGRAQGRYIMGALPELPFEANAFDIALCGHFLFLYASRFDFEFHFEALKEMCRVAREVRVYPIVTMRDGKRFPQLDLLLRKLEMLGIETEIRNIDYEFLKGSHQMLVLKR